MKVFVVSYQAYIYPYDTDNEIKYIMNENFDVRGVFSTKEKAKEFIDTRIKSIAVDLFGDNLEEDDDNYKYNKEFFEDEPNHWSIGEFQLDKQNFKD